MSIKPISKKSISDEVLEQIKSQILSGAWAPGSKIPGELELTGMFGVSRVSVREAIHRLAGMGVLLVRQGEGTFVTEMLPQDYFSSLLPILMIQGNDLLDVLEFRLIIEVQSAGLASERANESDIKAMELILQRMEEVSNNYEAFAREDLSFHAALSLATHNSVIVKVNAIIHDILQVAMEKIVKETGVEGGLRYHRKILAAIRERDKKAAMEIMHKHIDDTIKRMNVTA